MQTGSQGRTAGRENLEVRHSRKIMEGKGIRFRRGNTQEQCGSGPQTALLRDQGQDEG